MISVAPKVPPMTIIMDGILMKRTILPPRVIAVTTREKAVIIPISVAMSISVEISRMTSVIDNNLKQPLCQRETSEKLLRKTLF